MVHHFFKFKLSWEESNTGTHEYKRLNRQKGWLNSSSVRQDCYSLSNEMIATLFWFKLGKDLTMEELSRLISDMECRELRSMIEVSTTDGVIDESTNVPWIFQVI